MSFSAFSIIKETPVPLFKIKKFTLTIIIFQHLPKLDHFWEVASPLVRFFTYTIRFGVKLSLTWIAIFHTFHFGCCTCTARSYTYPSSTTRLDLVNVVVRPFCSLNWVYSLNQVWIMSKIWKRELEFIH